jgi:hypothetical protein
MDLARLWLWLTKQRQIYDQNDCLSCSSVSFPDDSVVLKTSASENKNVQEHECF